VEVMPGLGEKYDIEIETISTNEMNERNNI
jgi:hypothetical protein